MVQPDLLLKKSKISSKGRDEDEFQGKIVENPQS